MTTPLDGRLAALAPVSLAELDEAAALQTRRDRKYLVPVPAVAELVARLDGEARVLEIDGRRRVPLRVRLLRHAGPGLVPRGRAPPAAPVQGPDPDVPRQRAEPARGQEP